MNTCSTLQTALVTFLTAAATLIGVVVTVMKSSQAARDSKAVRKVAENGNGTSGHYDGPERRFLPRRAVDRENLPPESP